VEDASHEAAKLRALLDGKKEISALSVLDDGGVRYLNEEAKMEVSV